jgi:hypothetical protein
MESLGQQLVADSNPAGHCRARWLAGQQNHIILKPY